MTTNESQDYPARIDRYEVRREIGRGGMAVVLLAYDPRFKREVAIKLLPREFMHDSQFRERFEQEAQVIAALDHPALVPVYDFGEDNGQPYIIMRYMSGGSLAERIQKKPLKAEEASRLLSFVCSGLDEAHSKGVIHRDIKPGNILFDQRGDPFLSDFGIVSFAGSAAEASGSAMLGTPAYAAPEMIDVGRLSPLVDIYALGATLFEMLAGHTPFDAETPMGMMLAHLRKPVPDVRTERPELPEDVQYVVERAMAKEPALRYQRAGEIALDFKAAITTGIAESSLTMADISAQMLPSAHDNPSTERVQPDDPGTDRVSVSAFDDDPGTERVAPDDPGTERVAAGGPGDDPGTERVGAAGTAGKRTDSARPAGMPAGARWGLIGLGAVIVVGGVLAALGVFRGGGQPAATPTEPGAAVAQVTDTPDAATPAPTVEATSGPTETVAPTATPLPIRISAENALRLAVVSTLSGHTSQVTGLSWSPDSKLLASGASDGVRIWEVASGKNTLTYNSQIGVTGVAWSPDGKSIASTANGQPDVEVWDPTNGQLIKRRSGTATGTIAPAWSPDSTQLTFGGVNDSSTLWLFDKDLVPWNANYNESVTQQSFSPDGTRILVVLVDVATQRFGSVVVLTAQSGKVSQKLNGATTLIQPLSASWSPDGKRAAGGMADASVVIWNTEQGKPESTKILSTLIAHSTPVISTQYSPDGALIASASQDGIIVIWNAQSGERLQLMHSQGGVSGLAWSPNGVYLAAGSVDGPVTLWAVGQ